MTKNLQKKINILTNLVYEAYHNIGKFNELLLDQET